MVIVAHPKVRTGHDLLNLGEVESLKTDRGNHFFVALKREIVKVFALLVNFDPLVKLIVRKNLILSLKPKLLPKLHARLGAQDIMLSLLANRRLK